VEITVVLVAAVLEETPVVRLLLEQGIHQTHLQDRQVLTTQIKVAMEGQPLILVSVVPEAVGQMALEVMALHLQTFKEAMVELHRLVLSLVRPLLMLVAGVVVVAMRERVV